MPFKPWPTSTEISSQIHAAVLFDESGTVQGSKLADEGAAQALARAGADLLPRAGFRRRAATCRSSRPRPAQAASSSSATATSDRRDHRPRADVGLVFYDLKSALHGADGEPSKPKRPAGRRPTMKT